MNLYPMGDGTGIHVYINGQCAVHCGDFNAMAAAINTLVKTAPEFVDITAR